MFRKLLYWLMKVRHFDVYVPQWLYDFVDRKAILDEARYGLELMKKEIVYRRIQDYYENVDFGKVEIPAFLKADREINSLSKRQLDLLYLKAMEDEVA